MNKTLERTIGFAVLTTGLLLTTWGSYKLYDTMLGGQPHYVVMPRGAAGVKPGSNVQYEGVVVGEVAGTTPLLHTSPGLRKKANRAFHQKRHLLENYKSVGTQSENPNRKALISFRMNETSVPIGPSTYATGSAFYVTGRGYIVLKNRGNPEPNSDHTTFIPSSVRHPWLEQYVNLGMSTVPYFNRMSKLHTRLHNWYYPSEENKNRDRNNSGRAQLSSIPESINSWSNQARSIENDLRDAESTFDRVNSTLQSAIDLFPASGRSSNSAHSGHETWTRQTPDIDNGIMRKISDTEHSLRNQFLQLRHALESMDTQLQDVERQTLREGLIE